MTNPERISDELSPCPFCGLAEHLSLRAEGAYTPDMPARPYRVVCNHIDHDTVEGPIGYGRNGAIAAWNRRSPPAQEGMVLADSPAPSVSEPVARKPLSLFRQDGQCNCVVCLRVRRDADERRSAIPSVTDEKTK
jgi:hypothetical protein